MNTGIERAYRYVLLAEALQAKYSSPDTGLEEEKGYTQQIQSIP